MKKRNKLGLLALFLFVNVTVSFAQIDTAFWFAAPWVTPDHYVRAPIVIHLSTFNTPNTVVELRQPAVNAIASNGYDTTINIPANSTFNYTLWIDATATTSNNGFDSLEVRPANTVVPYGIYISSSANITAVYDVMNPSTNNNSETFSMKGQNGLGTEFVCPQQKLYRNKTIGNLANTPPGAVQPKQQIVIVATKPNTVVWITPKCNVVGHPANMSYSIMLVNPGDCYNVENVTQQTHIPGNNLGGTIVVSNKPIAITVADDSINNIYDAPSPNGNTYTGLGCYDLVGDQIVPVDIVGVKYIVNRGQLYKVGQTGGANNPGMKESAFIVATENLTQLVVNSGVSTTVTLNKGDTYVDTLVAPLTYYEATKPVYLYHTSGFGCELGAAILPPLDCAGSKLVAFSRNSNQQFALNILCKNGSQSTFTLNGSTALVTAGNFSMVPGTSALPGGPYWGAQVNMASTVTLPIGSYTIGNNANEFALGVFDGDYGSGGLFHYMSSFVRKVTVDVPANPTVCVGPGASALITGTVAGGAITGSWTTNGSGTFGAYTSTLGTVSTMYTLSGADTLLSSIGFTLTSIGSCKTQTNSLNLIVRQRPQVSVGTGSVICKNNLVPIQLTGSVSGPPIATGGAWSTSGTGFINPGINISYTPTPADLIAGSVTFTLNAIGGCSPNSRTLTASFIDPPVLTGFDNNICTNTQSVVLTSTVVGSAITPTWSTTNGTGFFNPTNVGLTPTYSVSASDHTLSVINFTLALNPGLPCGIVTETVQLTMRPEPTAIAPADFTVCANAGQFNLNGGISGSASTATWTALNGGGAFTPPTAPPVSSYSMSFADQSVGTLTFALQTDNGTYGCPPGHDTLKVAVLAAPVVAVNSNTSVCENAPVALTGTVTGYTNTGIWSSTGTGAFSPTNTALGGQYIPSNGDVANGSVTLTLLSTNNQGCPAQSASFTAVFIDAPQALFTPSTIRCKDSVITFVNGSQANGTSGLSYNWNFGDGPPNGTSTSTSPLYTYTLAGSYVITLTVTGTNTLTVPNVQCPDTVSKRITVNPLPLPNFTYLNGCQGLPASFKDSSIVIPGNVVGWNWQFGDGTGVTGLAQPIHTYTTAGVYNVVLTAITNNSCAATITKAVNINPQPIAEFGMTNDPTVALEPVYFSDFSAPTGSISSWLWSFGDEGTGDGPSPTHVYQNSGVYLITLTVFDNNGCSDTISKEIQVQILPQVPTAFTPNKDKNNDLLFVKGGPFEKILFRVYNNWGELLFETNDQSIGWDGTKNGKDQPVGVYVWTLVVDMYNNRQVKKNGDVTIIR